MEIMLTKVSLKPNFLTTKTQKLRGWLAKVIEVNRRKALVRQSAECTFHGKVAVDFFTCDCHLLSAATLRIPF